MEAGRITWADEDNIQDLRHLYCQRFVRSTPSAPSHAAPNMTKGPLFCLSFQNDKCPFNGDHNTTRGRVRHICAYCLRIQGVAFKHSETTCRCKAEKNEASTRPSAESPLSVPTSPPRSTHRTGGLGWCPPKSQPFLPTLATQSLIQTPWRDILRIHLWIRISC